MESDLDDETNNMAERKKTKEHKIPTFSETARKVARLEKRKLDEKQYIAYKMIASTFLLGLVNDRNDPTTTLYSCLGQTMGCTYIQKINDIVADWKQVVGKVN